MKFLLRHLVWAAVALGAASCIPPNIPGTDIADTPDARAILGVMQKYREALQARDAEGIIKLVAPNFRDDAGTTDPSDDLDFASLKDKLPARLAKLSEVTLDFSVRRVNVDRDVANAIFYYSASFRLPKLTAKPQNEGDLKQMWFNRVDGEWKIVSGI